MGGVLGVLQRATEIRGASQKLFVLTEAEVREDEACRAAQRASIKYCVDTLYYSAPVSISPVKTPTHHLPAALLTVDLERRRGGDGGSGPADGGAFPESCVVSPSGDILVTTRSPAAPAEVTRVIRAETLRSVVDPPAPPAVDGGAAATASALTVRWTKRSGDPASELIDAYEVGFREGADGGASPANWRALAGIDVARRRAESRRPFKDTVQREECSGANSEEKKISPSGRRGSCGGSLQTGREFDSTAIENSEEFQGGGGASPAAGSHTGEEPRARGDRGAPRAQRGL